nr:MAG: M protein [Almendravirus arboretum]
MLANQFVMNNKYVFKTFRIRYEASFKELPSHSDFKPILDIYDGKIKFYEIFTFVINYLLHLQIRNKVMKSHDSTFVMCFPVDETWTYRRDDIYSFHKDIQMFIGCEVKELRLRVIIDINTSNLPRSRLVRDVLKKTLSRLYDGPVASKMYEILKRQNEC